jgi:hypothetical protein
MLRLISIVLFLYLCTPTLTSCHWDDTVKKNVPDTLTQEDVDSLMRIASQQAITYKGIVANYGSREYSFTVDSGKYFEYRLISDNPALHITALQEKGYSISNPDSTTTYKAGYEKVSDSTIYSNTEDKKTNYKLKLYLTPDACRKNEIVKFDLKIKK